MLNRVISWSIDSRVLVVFIAILISIAGIASIRHIALDAIPDLSDVQVIVKTEFPGQAPHIVEDQVTYPLTSHLLSVPGAKTVRGYSYFGDSFVYVLFEDGTDLYWARSRVLEYLSQIQEQLPESANPALGPAASGVGWVYQYILTDRTGKHDLAELTSLQNWFLKYELQSLPGVEEVATIGGMVKQYQVVLDPATMQNHDLTVDTVKQSIVTANQEVGGSVIELGESEYMVRGKGYIQGIDDLRETPYLYKNGHKKRLKIDDFSRVQLGPQTRRGISDFNGEGEVVGGTIVMSSGSNAQTTIDVVKSKLEDLKRGLPDGVEIITVYDRSSLIQRAVNTLKHRLLEEFLLVAFICMIFLWHFRSSLVIILSLPVGIIIAFIIMLSQNINANIMSLGGIAIAIGAMVDASIVMIENAHKHLEKGLNEGQQRLTVIKTALAEVSTPLFYSLLIIAVSFLPILVLEAQEGKMFAPLAYTKTYAMAAAAGLSITLVPALIAFFVRGNIRKEEHSGLSQKLIAIYNPALEFTLNNPFRIILLSAILVVSTTLPFSKMGSEFMPDLNEGDILYMPTTLPGVSVGEARRILQITDKLIKSVPEVNTVFGKAGRSDSATDPAPLTMIETTIQLHPEEQWRTGMTMKKIIAELDDRVNIPGLTNAWLMPIEARIDMLSTGVKTNVGVKVSGPDLDTIQHIGQQVESLLGKISGSRSVFMERALGGHYIDIDIDREAAAAYNLRVSDVHEFISTAIGGENISYILEGRERYPVNLRYPQHIRNSVQKLRDLPVLMSRARPVRLSDLATIKITNGPAMIRSENARLTGWVYVDVNNRDLDSYVSEAQQQVADNIQLPQGYSISWSGQFEQLQRAKSRLILIIPLTLGIILILLYLTIRQVALILIIMGSIPLALVGGFWLSYLLGYHLSTATWAGFIALTGVAVEFAVVMIVFLEQAMNNIQPTTLKQLRKAIFEGGVQRVRPKAMTVSVVLAGLLPIMIGSGAGTNLIRHIAAPMIGGMVTAPLVSMLLIPAFYYLYQKHRLKL